MKKVLVTSTDSMMIQFLVPHINNLIENGYEVDIACSNVKNRIEDVKNALPNTKLYEISLARSPFKLRNLKGLKELKKIIKDGNYDLVWTNEPTMGVMTRLASKKARKKGTKVMYIAHGLHFFKGAPKKNWLIYYPIEKILSKSTDCLVLINNVDYKLATEKFKAKEYGLIPGTGINYDRFNGLQPFSKTEIGLNEENRVILSVGELNENKNQKVIIKALAQLNDKNIHYVLCGIGDNKEYLEKLAEESGVKENVHFMGYRKDVSRFFGLTDVFAFPSLREGLGIAPLEGMYFGLPLVSSNRHGINDYSEDGVTGFKYEPDDYKGFAEGIKKIIYDADLKEKMGNHNKEAVKKYGIDNSKKELFAIIKGLIG